jgi:hypothetical protein
MVLVSLSVPRLKAGLMAFLIRSRKVLGRRWSDVGLHVLGGVILVYFRMSRSEETAGTDGSRRARYPLL